MTIVIPHGRLLPRPARLHARHRRSPASRSDRRAAGRPDLRRRAPRPPAPRRAHAAWVLDELRAARTCERSFFLQGRWAEAFPDLARRDGGRGPPRRQPLLLSRTDAAAERRTASRRTSTRPSGSSSRRRAPIRRPWLRFPFGAGADRADLVERLRRARLPPRRLGRGGVRVGSRAARLTRSPSRRSRASSAHGDGAIVLLPHLARPRRARPGRDRRARLRDRGRALRRDSTSSTCRTV